MAEGSGAAAQKKRRNMEMAAHMKKLHTERHTGRCSICYQLIGREIGGGKHQTSGSMQNHIVRCPGPRSPR